MSDPGEERRHVSSPVARPGTSNRKRNLPINAEVELDQDIEELTALESNGRKAGSGGFQNSKISKQSVFVVSAIANTKEKVDDATKEFLRKNNTSLIKEWFIVGGKCTAHYPDVQLTCIGQEDKYEDHQLKFFSMIIPTKLINPNQEYRFFIRKGTSKANNDTMLELSEAEIISIERKFASSFWPYLQAINGKKYSSIEEIPPKPDVFVVREIDERNKIVFKIDDYSLNPGSNGRLMPNLSIRDWEYKKRGWQTGKKGFILSCHNFFLFSSVTLNAFLNNVKTAFGNLSESIQDIIDGEEVDTGDDDQEIEPFPN
jgi:hypothetical protein